MMRDDLLKRMEREIIKGLETDIFRGHFHELSTTTGPEQKTLTYEDFISACDRAMQSPSPVSLPVDLPDYMRVRLYYRMSEHAVKQAENGDLIFYKINTIALFGQGEPMYVFHPDNEDEFRKAADSAGAFAVDLAKFQRGEVDEYGRPIKKDE